MSIRMHNDLGALEARVAALEEDRAPVGISAKLAELEKRLDDLARIVKEDAAPIWHAQFAEELRGEIQGLKMRMGKRGVFGV